MRLAAIDALHLFGGIPNYPDDVCPVAVIDSPTGSPAFDDIRAILAERANTIPALRELPRKVPFNLDYPHWVRDNQPVERLIVEHPAREWHTVLAAVTELTHTPVDAEKDGWRIVVFRDVEGAPGVSSLATVVLHQASHAITAGAGSSQILRVLFGDESALERVPGHGSPSDNVGVREALTGLLRLPRDIRAAVSATSADRRLSTMTNAPEPRISASLNTIGKGRSFVDIRPVDTAALKTLGTVTETALVAVSIALAAYLAEQGESADGLTAVLPVAPKSFGRAALPVPAANTAGARAIVSLHATVTDLHERAKKIKRDLTDQLLVCESDEVVAVRQGFEATPSFVLAASRTVSGRASKPAASLTVNSYDRGPADLELLGDPVRYIGASATISPLLALTAQFNGLGDTTAVSVAADSSVPAPERFAELLHDAIDDVGRL